MIGDLVFEVIKNRLTSFCWAAAMCSIRNLGVSESKAQSHSVGSGEKTDRQREKRDDARKRKGRKKPIETDLS